MPAGQNRAYGRIKAFFDLEWEQQDFQEAIKGIRQGYADVKAGRTRPAAEFLEELRAKHGFPLEISPQAEEDATNSETGKLAPAQTGFCSATPSGRSRGKGDDEGGP